MRAAGGGFKAKEVWRPNLASRTGGGQLRRPPGSEKAMVEPQSHQHAGRAKILEAGEKIDAGEYTLEDMMEQIEAIPANKKLLRQIGVRDSVKRVRAPRVVHPARLSETH